jgi:triosephosphate isomerase (TIM)
MRTLIVNCKNYAEVQGDGAVRLAEAVRGAGSGSVEAIIAPPAPTLGLVVRTGARVFSQDVGTALGDKTTGAVVPEAVKAVGVSGTILNHSESRKKPKELAILVPRLRKIGLEVCLCARTSAEAARLSRLGTKYIAVEPPELIGSGVAVSRAKPGLILKTVEAVRRAGYSGSILCGAGIVSGEDVKAAVRLGTDGILVSSSVVKATDWRAKLKELADSLI